MYENMGKYWSAEEDAQLIKEYNIDNLKFSDIIIIHKRLPGGIKARLKKLNLAKNQSEIRGYDEYTKSDLYTQNKIYKQKRKLVIATLKQDFNNDLEKINKKIIEDLIL
jgi:hypothetical protein